MRTECGPADETKSALAARKKLACLVIFCGPFTYEGARGQEIYRKAIASKISEEHSTKSFLVQV